MCMRRIEARRQIKQSNGSYSNVLPMTTCPQRIGQSARSRGLRGLPLCVAAVHVDFAGVIWAAESCTPALSELPPALLAASRRTARWTSVAFRSSRKRTRSCSTESCAACFVFLPGGVTTDDCLECPPCRRGSRVRFWSSVSAQSWRTTRRNHGRPHPRIEDNAALVQNAFKQRVFDCKRLVRTHLA